MKQTAHSILEKVANTAVFAFVGALPVTLPLTNDALSAAGWAGLTAAICAVLSLLKNLVAAASTTPAGNLIDRFAWTAVQAFAAAIPATFALTASDSKAVALMGVNAAVAAVLSLAKNLTSEGTIHAAVQRGASIRG